MKDMRIYYFTFVSFFTFISLNLLIGVSESCFQQQKGKEDIEFLFNKVNFELTRLLDKNNKDNYVYSSYSMLSAVTPMISMLNKVSKQRVETCMGTTLKGLQAFINTRNENTNTFNEATKIWLDEAVRVKNNQTSEAIKRLMARIDIKNGPDRAEKFINNWVSDKTHGKIKNLLPRGVLNNETKIVITNAIAFRGSWKFPFDDVVTKNRSFHVSANRVIQVPTMANTINTYYYRGSKLGQMLALPYKGDEYCMYIVLPKNTKSINIDLVTKAMTKMQLMKVKVLLPKFKMTSSFNMKGYISDLGLQDLFTKVDILEDDLYFTDILHKVSVTVDETGTVAGGGTAIITGRMMLPTFRVNRPFYFFIKNIHTNVIIFSGKITNPKS